MLTTSSQQVHLVVTTEQRQSLTTYLKQYTYDNYMEEMVDQ